MELLKTINLEGVVEGGVNDWQKRTSARAIVFDKEEKIGLLHVTKDNYYKLPGGGVEEGEDIRQALDRECKEELGVNVDVTNEVGMIVEYRAKYKLHQTSYCFVAKTSSIKGEPSFTEKEISWGFQVVWVTKEEARRLLSLREAKSYEGKFIMERDIHFLERVLIGA